DVVDAARAYALRMEAARQVLQRRLVLRRRDVLVRVVIELEDMAEGVFEAVGAAMAEIALDPADLLVGAGLDCLDAALQSFRRRGAERDMTDAGRVRLRQLHGVELVIVPCTQIDGVLVAAAFLQTVD